MIFIIQEIFAVNVFVLRKKARLSSGCRSHQAPEPEALRMCYVGDHTLPKGELLRPFPRSRLRSRLYSSLATVSAFKLEHSIDGSSGSSV
jgi:hypothetical protein